MKVAKKQYQLNGTAVTSPVLYNFIRSKTMAFLPRNHMKWFNTDILVSAMEMQVEIKKMVAELNKKK